LKKLIVSLAVLIKVHKFVIYTEISDGRVTEICHTFSFGREFKNPNAKPPPEYHFSILGKPRENPLITTTTTMTHK
jgi:hypothetical protein